MNTTQDPTQKAETLGRKAGENAADFAIQYLWGGRITRGAKECADSFIKANEEGDPRIFDAFTLPNLSGEWADEENPNDLFEKCTGHEYFPDADDHQETMDEICTAWENAAHQAFFDTLEKSARDFLAEE
jgi:hypothetical protein